MSKPEPEAPIVSQESLKPALEFVQKLRRALDNAAAVGDMPALVCSGGIRLHVRAIVERFRPTTPVLAQAEIHSRAHIRILGSI